MGYHADPCRGDYPWNVNGTGYPAVRYPVQQPAADIGEYYPWQSRIPLHDRKRGGTDIPSENAAD